MDFNSEKKFYTSQTSQSNDQSSELNLKFHANDINKYTYFLEKPHKNLYCPVCFNLYKIPILIDCSHTICDECIESFDEKIEENSNQKLKKCPIDGKICTIKLLNKNIAEQIDDHPIR